MKYGRIFGFLIFSVSIVFLAWQIYSNIDELAKFDWGARQWGFFLFSVCFCFLNIVIGAFLWRRLLSDQLSAPPLKKILQISLMAAAAKYLPGNIGQHIARVHMIQKEGVGTASAVRTILLESLFGLGVSAALALLAIFIFVDASSVVGVSPQLLLLVAGITFAFPWLLPRILPGIIRHRLKENLASPKLNTIISATFFFLTSFFTIGLALYFQLIGVFQVNSASILQLTSTFALIWIAGYLTPGAPAGLGVREALTVLLLSPTYGEPTAIGLGIALRLATILADTIAVFAGFAMKRCDISR